MHAQHALHKLYVRARAGVRSRALTQHSQHSQLSPRGCVAPKFIDPSDTANIGHSDIMAFCVRAEDGRTNDGDRGRRRDEGTEEMDARMRCDMCAVFTTR